MAIQESLIDLSQNAIRTTSLPGSGLTVGQTAGPWAVSGTISANPHAVFQTAGPWAVSGTITTQGLTASGAVFSGNPQVIAGLYVSGGVGQVLVIPLSVDALGRLVIQGQVPAGSGLMGNPVVMGGSDGVNAQALLVQSAASPNLRVGIFNGVSQIGIDTAGDGRGSVNYMPVRADQYIHNGINQDRARGNTDVIHLSAAIRASGSITSADITTYNCRGIAVYLDIVAASGAFQQFQLTINGKDPGSSKYVPILSGGIVASGGIQPSPTTMAYKIYPGISGNFAGASTGVSLQSVVSDHVPRVIQIVLSPVANINYYYTASIGYTLLY